MLMGNNNDGQSKPVILIRALVVEAAVRFAVLYAALLYSCVLWLPSNWLVVRCAIIKQAWRRGRRSRRDGIIEDLCSASCAVAAQKPREITRMAVDGGGLQR